MKKERKITAPDGCEIEKVELIDGVAVVTFKQKERKLPKSWEEFCEMYQIKAGECYVGNISEIKKYIAPVWRDTEEDKNILPDHATAEAVLALCKLIQLRDCYNGDWVPDWDDEEQDKYVITFLCCDVITITDCYNDAYSPLFFNNEKLAKEFLRNFRPLIEKLKPLYGIKEGGEK